MNTTKFSFIFVVYACLLFVGRPFRAAGVSRRPEGRPMAPNCSACSPSGACNTVQPICPYLTRIGMHQSALHSEMALGSPSWARVNPVLQDAALSSPRTRVSRSPWPQRMSQWGGNRSLRFMPGSPANQRAGAITMRLAFLGQR